MRTDTVQRVRVTFAIEWPLCYASVLDLGRLWDRLLRRAELPLAYSQGFNPHPRLAFAAALPVGYTSECEMVDILLAERVATEEMARRIDGERPAGLSILSVDEVPLNATAPQSTMRQADYVVRLEGAFGAGEAEQALDALLARPHVMRERFRKGRVREYDLRALIHEAVCEEDGAGGALLRLRLACGSQGAGRPEEVVDELGLAIERQAIRRVRLLWDAASGDREGDDR